MTPEQKKALTNVNAALASLEQAFIQDDEPQPITITEAQFNDALQTAVSVACRVGILKDGEVPLDVYEQSYSNMRIVLMAVLSVLNIATVKE
jgi:hypothetical protein